MQVIEVDQWTASGNIEEQKFDSVTLEDISGGDSEAVKTIFGGNFVKKEVSDNDLPSIGSVWYKKAENGNCEIYKVNYDSSD